MSRVVRFTRRARQQLTTASAWWLENRDKAPEAFENDLGDMLVAISETPGIGSSVPARRPGTRRVVLKRLGYLLYYRIEPDGDILVVALWHASRGSHPRL